MRIEVTFKGVAKNRVYYATPVTQGRPRKTAEIIKSKKPFATGSTRQEAVQSLLTLVGFVPHNESA
jgi:3-isopropylmalate dehydratase small subunit